MGRRFNTAGPCRPAYDYMIPPLRRLPQAPGLVDSQGYFVVHAPRQTGKTTVIRALGDELTASGRYAALAFTCETGEAAGDNYRGAQRAILQEIRNRAEDALPPDLWPPPWPDVSDEGMLRAGLRSWAHACPRPLVLFFDEIDALRGQSLISVLRQLRAGYNERPAGFPASVILCGLRDVRDYKAAAGGDPSRLGDFSPEEVRELYHQHTAETGQEFTPDALERAVALTGGQPWLVNALANEIVVELAVPVTEPITVVHMEEAKERLVLARATHLDSLVDKLRDPRVKRILEPVLAGTLETGDTYNDDLQYVRDLGLVASRNPVRIANPIYQEVIARVLAGPAEALVLIDDPRSLSDVAGSTCWSAGPMEPPTESGLCSGKPLS
jgi:hypothetical protein